MAADVIVRPLAEADVREAAFWSSFRAASATRR